MPNLSQPTTEPVAKVKWTDNGTTHIGRVVRVHGDDVVVVDHCCAWSLVQHWPYDVSAKFEWVQLNRLAPYTGAKGTAHA